jgi:hypothetical protein
VITNAFRVGPVFLVLGQRTNRVLVVSLQACAPCQTVVMMVISFTAGRDIAVVVVLIHDGTSLGCPPARLINLMMHGTTLHY